MVLNLLMQFKKYCGVGQWGIMIFIFQSRKFNIFLFQLLWHATIQHFSYSFYQKTSTGSKYENLADFQNSGRFWVKWESVRSSLIPTLPTDSSRNELYFIFAQYPEEFWKSGGFWEDFHILDGFHQPKFLDPTSCKNFNIQKHTYHGNTDYL